MTVTVYSKTSCVQCDSTYRALLTAGIEFEVIALEGNKDALDYVKELGHLQAPIVVAGDQHWAGYRPDRITGIKRSLLEQGVELQPRKPDVVSAMIKDIKSKVKEATLATV